jgi:hypothetical protein
VLLLCLPIKETLLCKKTRYDGKRLIIKKTLADQGLLTFAVKLGAAAGKSHPAGFPLVAPFAGGNEVAVRKKRLDDFFPMDQPSH